MLCKCITDALRVVNEVVANDKSGRKSGFTTFTGNIFNKFPQLLAVVTDTIYRQRGHTFSIDAEVVTIKLEPPVKPRLFADKTASNESILTPLEGFTKHSA